MVFLQLTGGEPSIDPLFTDVYATAYDLGMMLTILTNGSRLATPKVLGLLTTRPPQDITISVYGATEETYDRLTRRRGSYRAFSRGLTAAHEAGLPVRLSLIITKTNAHETAQMQDLANRLGLRHDLYVNMSPTIYGGPETLPPSPRPTCASAKSSPAATPATRSSTSTRTATPASARSAATPPSRSSTKEPTACAGWARSPTHCSSARAAAPAAPCRPAAAPACP